MPQVRVILGSKSDLEACQPIKDTLEEFGVDYDWHISSAHRKPQQTTLLAQNAASEGVKVIIACAGMAAHLPGVIASHTHLPVIGVPLSGSALGGKDALYSIVQMPPGVPVACVAINGSKNAALLAIQILAISQPALAAKMQGFKEAFVKA
ncbi:MAG: 5-(carboxyamino)imidazole ribonucleotide mutase [Candidatus Cloacimonetes bacterium]|nr:5-(carboxyamino)imidazole ribonucleotide mutase [Candidatus Cloacimonadota bacterium]NLO12259.1 5-(carboxyamino)imidazole ribonucleotide mutase [Candidatus Cloacimonadota bacterium]